MKLDIGCNTEKVKGYLGLDKYDYGQRYVQDIRNGIPDGDWEEIRIKHCLEHLTQDEAIKLLNDCWGRCKVLEIIVPSVHNPDRAYHLDHKSFYSEGTFNSLNRLMTPEIKTWKVKRMVMGENKDLFVWLIQSGRYL